MACAGTEDKVETTQTNEQDCTRIRSVGPQDPYADPAPLKQACLGPHLFEIPQNYFYNQIGTEHDGGFSIALDYPSLLPFKPGERMNLSREVSARTVNIDPMYIDRLPVQEVLRREYAMSFEDPPPPEETLEGRVSGEPRYGLTPYRVDFPKTLAFYKERAFKDNRGVTRVSWHDEWLITRDAEGTVDRFIKCRLEEGEQQGIGDIPDLSPAPGMPKCEHIIILPEISTKMRIVYPRVALPRWKEIEGRARSLIEEFKKR
jgi:hypothetical protein